MEEQRQKYALYVALTGILCVSVLIALIIFFFGTNHSLANAIFKEPSDVLQGLSLTFGIIGTLAGTYFGIKSSNEARTQVDRARQDAHELASKLATQNAPATTEQPRRAE